MNKNSYNDSSFFPFTPISNTFIENYFNSSNPSFILIYIYLLKESFNKNFLTLDFLAKKFEILQADVLAALKFWEEKNIIYYSIDEKGLINITFLPIYENNLKNFEQSILESKKPVYTPDEIDKFYKDEEIVKLLKLAERIFSKSFSYTDREKIISTYNWLKIPLEVWAVLFTYCVTNNKNNVRYIEKVAIDWDNNGIDTVQKAESYISLIKNDYKEILVSFGIKNREPIEEEMNIIKKWLFELNMPLEIVKEACKRTILKINNVSFNYANSIIVDWDKKKVRTLDDIKRLDESFEKKSKNYKESYKIEDKVKIRPSKFINYPQPEYNFEELKELEYERLKERTSE